MPGCQERREERQNRVHKVDKTLVEAATLIKIFVGEENTAERQEIRQSSSSSSSNYVIIIIIIILWKVELQLFSHCTPHNGRF